MGVRISSIPARAAAAANKLIHELSSGLTGTIAFDDFADWVLQTYEGFIQSGTGAIAEPVQAMGRRVIFSGQYGTLQQALNAAAGKILYIEGTNAITSPLTPSNNTTIEFLPGATVTVATGVFSSNHAIFSLNERSNVTIKGHGATITGSREGTGTDLVWHGVSIRGCSNIRVEDLTCANMAGDGFYVDRADDGTPAYSENVWLIRCKANNCMRQGLSVISCKNLWVIEPVMTNTNGKSPSAGIDLEPDTTDEFMENINVIRPYCAGNDGVGILVFLGTWNSASNYCSINIVEAHTKDNGSSATSSDMGGGIEVRRMKSTTPSNGRISIVRPFCEDEYRCGIRVLDWDVNGPRIEITDPFIVNPNQSAGSTPTLNGGIILYSDSNHTTTPGNVRITNPNIVDDDGNLSSLNCFYINGVGGGWDNVVIENPEYTFGGSTPWFADSNTKGFYVRSYKEHLVTVASGTTISDARYIGRVINNDGASDTSVITLPQATSERVGWELTFRNMEAQEFRIDTNAADRVIPTGASGSAGAYIVSSVSGSEITLRVQEAGFWSIKRESGSWTLQP